PSSPPATAARPPRGSASARGSPPGAGPRCRDRSPYRAPRSRSRGGPPRCSNARTPGCSAASGSRRRRAGRSSLEQLLDRLPRLVGRSAFEVNRALAHLLLDVADGAARDPLRLRLLDERAHLGGERVRPLRLRADLLGA